MKILTNIPQTGEGDAGAAIQKAINSGGLDTYILPPGNYTGSTIIIAGGIRLCGSGRGCTLFNGMIDFQNAGFSGLEDIFINAPQDPNINAITIDAQSVSVALVRVRSQGGAATLYTQGADCCFSDCYFGDSVGMGAVVSNGNSWYERCKIDSQSRPSGFYAAFYQGNARDNEPMENHFTDCDFSGPYDASVCVQDSASEAITVITGGVFSSPVIIGRARCTILTACEVGGDINNNGGAEMIVSGCWGISNHVVSGKNVTMSGNR